MSITCPLDPILFTPDGRLRPGIRRLLLHAADIFAELIRLPAEAVMDVTLTGSRASCRQRADSDIDLHLVYDPALVAECDEAFVDRALRTMAKLFDRLYDPRPLGLDLEIMPQRLDEPHPSAGVYSVRRDRWLVSPSPPIRTGRERQAALLAEVLGVELRRLADAIDRTGDWRAGRRALTRLRRWRRRGLLDGGADSLPNLVFRELRARGDLRRLVDAIRAAVTRDLEGALGEAREARPTASRSYVVVAAGRRIGPMDAASIQPTVRRLPAGTRWTVYRLSRSSATPLLGFGTVREIPVMSGTVPGGEAIPGCFLHDPVPGPGCGRRMAEARRRLGASEVGTAVDRTAVSERLSDVAMEALRTLLTADEPATLHGALEKLATTARDLLPFAATYLDGLGILPAVIGTDRGLAAQMVDAAHRHLPPEVVEALTNLAGTRAGLGRLLDDLRAGRVPTIHERRAAEALLRAALGLPREIAARFVTGRGDDTLVIDRLVDLWEHHGDAVPERLLDVAALFRGGAGALRRALESRLPPEAGRFVLRAVRALVRRLAPDL